MPIVGSTAYLTAGQVATRVRALLNDSAGLLFSDTVLIPYIDLAYTRVQRKLKNIGSATFEVDQAFFVIPAVASVDSSVQVSISDSTAPPNQLPVDLIEPLKMWERPNLSTNQFVEMADMTDSGGIPSQPQGQTLSMWEWRQDAINFLGATVDVQVRLRYRKGYPTLADTNSAILIRDAKDACSFGAAAMASEARGSPLAKEYDAAFEDAIEDLMSGITRELQGRPRRRRPFSYRNSQRAPAL